MVYLPSLGLSCLTSQERMGGDCGFPTTCPGSEVPWSKIQYEEGAEPIYSTSPTPTRRHEGAQWTPSSSPMHSGETSHPDSGGTPSAGVDGLWTTCSPSADVCFFIGCRVTRKRQCMSHTSSRSLCDTPCKFKALFSIAYLEHSCSHSGAYLPAPLKSARAPPEFPGCRNCSVPCGN